MIKYNSHILNNLIRRFGAVTKQQLIELFGSDPEFDVEKITRPGYYESKIVILPVIHKPVEIVYFSDHARAWEDQENECLYLPTPLEGINYGRLYHELLIVQVLLFFIKQRGSFVDFLTENELKREGENPADLRVLTGDGYIDCEIVVTNHRDQIAAKSADMWYFTPFQTKKDYIDAAKKTDAILIDLQFDQQQIRIHNAKLNTTEKRILDVLNRHGEILTAGAIATLMQKDRGYLVKVLNGLVEKGVLISETIQRDKEKPSKVFTQNPDLIRSFLQRSFGVMTSKLIEKVLPHGFNLIRASRQDRLLTFQKADLIQLVYVQNTDNDVREDMQKLKSWQQYAAFHRYKINYLNLAAKF